ncbi:large neutral amino acids transporter small subunit 1-like isoform X3 [Branchiostoma floridae x Branchiostoma belcheri]
MEKKSEVKPDEYNMEESEKNPEQPEKPPSEASVGVRMKRQLTLTNGVATIMCIIIGSGIFLSPKGVLRATGSVGLSLIVWTLSGVLSLLGALCYAELGTTIPKSGGDYMYLHEIFGPWVAFVNIWQNFTIVLPCATAVVAITVAQYVLYPFFTPCPAPYLAVRLIAAVSMGLVGFANCYSVRLAARMNNVFTFLKLGALGIIIVFGGIQLARGHTDNLDPANAFDGTTSSVGDAMVSFYSALWAYSGWQSLNAIVEELKNPTRTLPQCVAISVPLVTVMFVLTNIAYFTAMTPDELLASDAVAVTFANRLLGTMSWIIPLAVAVSTFGTLLTNTLAFSRPWMVAAREGTLPRILSMIQIDRLTPAPAVILRISFSLLMLIPDDVYKVLNLMGFAGWLSSAFTVIGLLWWRYKRPDLPRPIKMNLAIPVLFVLLSLFMVVVSFVSAPVECGFGLAILASAVPVYAVFVHWKNKPAWFMSFEGYVTTRLQMILNVVPQDSTVKIK